MYNLNIERSSWENIPLRKDTRMNTWSDGYVNANGIRIHYYRSGGAKPGVVLNHGALDDGLCWTRVAKALEADYDVVMLDGRGHGLSDSGAGDYRPETRAKDIAEAIQALGLDRPVVGGQSMGAEASLHLAAGYQDLAGAIFMEDPPIVMPGQPVFGGMDATQGDRVYRLLAVILKVIKILPMFIGKTLARKMMPNSPDEEIIPWLLSKKRIVKDLFKNLKASGVNDISVQLEALRKVKVPTLLIMGDRELGSIVSSEVAQEMATVLPSLQVAHLAGANHDIRRAKFEEYIVVLREFLARVTGQERLSKQPSLRSTGKLDIL